MSGILNPNARRWKKDFSQAMTWLLAGHFGPVADGTMLVSAWIELTR